MWSGAGSIRPERPIVLVVGTESAGKSTLVGGLARCSPRVANLRGTTVACESYPVESLSLVDSPGVQRSSDGELVRISLDALRASDVVLLVVRATRLEDDLEAMRPLVVGKSGLVVVTFADAIERHAVRGVVLESVRRSLGVSLIAVDARRLDDEIRRRILFELEHPRAFRDGVVRVPPDWRPAARRTPFDRPWLGPAVALLVLLAPGFGAAFLANAFADALAPSVERVLEPLAAGAARLPGPLTPVVGGPYGIVSMAPFLVLYALPTVVLFAGLIGAYKTTGLVERLSVALHPWTIRCGLSGRDLVRVVMGFGCNVPAVVSSRACSACSRRTCVAAIAFGAACSYQLPATLAVYAAAGERWLVVPYLAALGGSTLLYARWVSTPASRDPRNRLVSESTADPLQPPRWVEIRREIAAVLGEFARKSLPVFTAVCLVASLLEASGGLRVLAAAAEPATRLLGLPAETSLAIVFSAVRKDAILLLAEERVLATLGPASLLAVTYLAGTLVPCLVTALAIAREISLRFAVRLLLRQAAAAIVFTVLLRRAGAWIAA